MRRGRFGAVGAAIVVLALAVQFAGAGAAAGSVVITDLDAPSTVEPGDRVHVDVTVRNDMDEEADELEIRVRGFDQVKTRTLYNLDEDETVDVDVTLNVPSDADGRETVRVTAQARDDDDVILSDDSATTTVRVDDDGTTTDARDIEIAEVATPARVQAGTSIEFDVMVENTGSSDTFVDVSVDAFGQLKRVEDVRVNDGQTKTVTLNMTVPRDASGPEDAEVIADAGGDERDVMIVTLRIATLSMTMQLSPDDAEVGEPVTVSGLMSAAGVEADLYVGGLYETSVRSDETAHYSHTITVDRPGTFRVELRADGVRTERFLQVVSALSVDAVTVPGTVGAGETTTVCGTVSRTSPGETEVALLVDGSAVTTRSVVVEDEREVCFDATFDDTGEHTVTVRAEGGGAQDSLERTVSVVETGVTASVFPRGLTLQRGQAGVIQVEIGNDELKRRTFTVTLSGLPNVTGEREHEVTLDAGARETVVFRLVPQSLGTVAGNVTVTAEGATVADERVEVAAVQNPALKNPVFDAARDVAGDVQDRFARLPQEQQWGVIGGIVVLVLGGIWFWRRRSRPVMTPRY